MNLFAITADGRLITPALTETILEGVTRGAILQLASDAGLQVEEARIARDDLFADIDAGRISEVFACGTAAVITPVASFKDPDGVHAVRDREPGPQTLALRQALTEIQYGLRPDPYGWMTRIL